MKYYRVKIETFLWNAGAILSDQDKGQYLPLEDIWNKVPGQSEYISAKIVEAPENAETFEKVYKNTIGGSLYQTKDQLLALYQNAFK